MVQIRPCGFARVPVQRSTSMAVGIPAYLHALPGTITERKTRNVILVEPGSPLVRLLIGGCTDKTCRQRVGTYACIRFVDGVGSWRVSHDEGEGGREWSDDGDGGDDEGEAIPRDTKRVLKRTRGRCRDVA
ncbi:hypothetical protein ALC57_07102 [Trachymyrmex cornetzi]|uniref:Uncharacterized protein n=1 Tax=Trachymyrmex cornetzi TaxID=471704 RepID=A0A195E6W6_9HYME|nr:hypothetical protein ALC57_07102 [Trachymyrmex cornetzi]